MSAIRSSGTKAEQALAALIAETFPRRKVIMHADLPGRPDFFLPGLRAAVFVNGCFWHACVRHGRTPDDNAEYWIPKLQRNRSRDRKADRRLREAGIRPVRIWEHDLRGRAAITGRERVRRRLLRLAP